MRFLHRNPAHFIFGLPAAARFFFEEDTGGNASGGSLDTGAPSGVSSPLDDFQTNTDEPMPPAGGERLEGERAPDFGSLGKKTPSEAPKGTDTPPKEEKPAGEAPAKEKPASKATAKAIGTPAKVEEPAKPAEKPAEPAKPAEAKPDEAKLPEIPKDDSDLDALKPKPGVPSHVVKSFDDMRARMKTERATARQAIETATKLQQEFEALKSSTGKLPEDVEKELEGLRNFHQLFQAEQDPRFKAQFEAPITKAEESIYAFLKANGMPDKVIEEIKKVAAENNKDIEAWGAWDKVADSLKNPIDRQQLLSTLQARRDAIATKDARLREIAGSREKFTEAVGNMDKEEQDKFSKQLEQASIPLAAANDWILEEDIPADATAEQRAAIEARNAKAKEYAGQFGDYSREAYFRNPDKIAEMAVKAVKADHLEAQVESIRVERDKATARVKELEDRIAKVRSAGRIAHVDAPAPETVSTNKTTVEEGRVGGDGQSAIQQFFRNR